MVASSVFSRRQIDELDLDVVGRAARRADDGHSAHALPETPRVRDPLSEVVGLVERRDLDVNSELAQVDAQRVRSLSASSGGAVVTTILSSAWPGKTSKAAAANQDNIVFIIRRLRARPGGVRARRREKISPNRDERRVP